MKNKFPVALLIINMLFLLVSAIYLSCVKRYIISFISFSQILTAYFLISSIAAIVNIIATHKNKIKAVIAIIVIFVTATVLSFICINISDHIFRNPKLKEITIDNTSNDSGYYVWEYETFRARNLYVCKKMNAFKFNKIPGAAFSVEPGFDPLESNAFFAKYDVNNSLLIIQYKIDDDCNWETIETYVSLNTY